MIYSGLGIVAGIAAGRMFYFNLCGIWEGSPRADRERRSNAGMGVVVGVLSGLLWPAFLPFIYCLTGFAEYGLIHYRRRA